MKTKKKSSVKVNTIRSVSKFFQKEPKAWGMSGDRYLWREMKKKLKGIKVISREDLLLTLEACFNLLANCSLTSNKKTIQVEKYRYGKMATGTVSLEFWRETALPLIVERYLKSSSKITIQTNK